MQIGGRLKSGEKHDGSAPDYDDWSLNGDIIENNRVRESGFQISYSFALNNKRNFKIREQN